MTIYQLGGATKNEEKDKSNKSQPNSNYRNKECWQYFREFGFTKVEER